MVGAGSVRSMRFDSASIVDCDVLHRRIGRGRRDGRRRALAPRIQGGVDRVRRRRPGDELLQAELEGTRRLYLDSGFTASRDLGVAILAGSCLGGGTAVNWQTCLRTPRLHPRRVDRTIRMRAVHQRRVLPMRSTRRATRIGASVDESEVNANNGGDSARLRGARLRVDRDGAQLARLRHRQCGYCIFGCRAGGKQSTVVTYLQTVPRGRKRRRSSPSAEPNG